MAFSLSPQSKKVIDAFIDQQPASNKKLTSTGKTLDGNWMGGSSIAVWMGAKIVLKETGSKAGDTVQNYIRRNTPKNRLASSSASDILNGLENRIARLERTANRNKMKKDEEILDEHLIREIELHIENTQSNYKNIQNVISMVKKHLARGKYSESRALDGFLNLVVVPGIKDYRREFGRSSLPSRIDAKTKKTIAKSLFETYEDEILE